MPVYNAENFLREAIESILSQTFKDFEFLIINDGSTDNSNKIILSYKDSRIIYVKNDKNLGQAETMNRGLKIAKAELIARMDADDISHPERLEKQYFQMKKDKSLAILASDFDVINEEGGLLYEYRHARSSEEIYYILQFRNCVGHPTVMFRKHIILGTYRGYDMHREAEDYDLWLRVSKTHKISIINHNLLKLRTSRESRMGAIGGRITHDAALLAQANLESLTKKKIELDIIKLLTIHFAIFRFSFPVNYSKEKVREALKILKLANNSIRKNKPDYVNTKLLRCIMYTKTFSLHCKLLFIKIVSTNIGLYMKRLIKASTLKP